MTTEQVIGCKDDKDVFHCFDCRFKPDTPECDKYRMTWELDVFYEGDDVAFASDEDAEYASGMKKKCIQLGEVLI